jgi:serine/threonine protein phosphatase PrpC
MGPDRSQPEPYPQTCPACGGELGIDGYCLTCGQKARSLREHYELEPVSWLAGVCDIGQLHARNEDALMCAAQGDRAVVVVCDGVTTSQDSDLASMAAAKAACQVLWTNNPQGLGTPASRASAVAAVITQAVAAANEAVIDQTDPASPNSAATTIALAVIDGSTAYCANVGDSRVYWLPDEGEPQQMTKDHSLAQDGMDLGTGRAEAESSAMAHTITKWLGRDATDISPNMATLDIDIAGWLLVCSDGLWNYVSEAADLRSTVVPLVADQPTARQLAARLVDWANRAGGHDNITVACARLQGHDCDD